MPPAPPIRMEIPLPTPSPTTATSPSPSPPPEPISISASLSFNYWVTDPATTIDYSVYVMSNLAGFADGNQHGVGTLSAGSVAGQSPAPRTLQHRHQFPRHACRRQQHRVPPLPRGQFHRQLRIHRVDDVTVSTPGSPPSSLLTNPGFEATPFDSGWNLQRRDHRNRPQRLRHRRPPRLQHPRHPRPVRRPARRFHLRHLPPGRRQHHQPVVPHPARRQRRHPPSKSAAAPATCIQLNDGGTYGDLTAIADGSNFPIPANTPIRIRVIGRGFGTATANYDVAWSDPGATTLSHAATGPDRLRPSPPPPPPAPDSPASASTATDTAAHSYWVDDVSVIDSAEYRPRRRLRAHPATARQGRQHLRRLPAPRDDQRPPTSADPAPSSPGPTASGPSPTRRTLPTAPPPSSTRSTPPSTASSAPSPSAAPRPTASSTRLPTNSSSARTSSTPPATSATCPTPPPPAATPAPPPTSPTPPTASTSSPWRTASMT